jgi:AmpD protein
MTGVQYIPSPNQDDRPDEQAPELIVVHGISLPPGEFGGSWIDHLFTNCLDPHAHPYFREISGLKVSSHFLIRRDGEIIQYVPVNRRAWHAGESCYKGRSACNDYYVGIELEGEDDTPYEAVQYDRLLSVIKELMAAYPAIGEDDIVGHVDIAPGRKTDPGLAFNWNDFRKKLSTRLASSTDVDDT